MQSITVGIDLAKQLFSVCVVDAHGKVQLRKDLRREALVPWLAGLPADTVVAMEVCSSAHHRARVCTSHGLVPRLMAAQFVTPFRKSAGVKNDRVRQVEYNLSFVVSKFLASFAPFIHEQVSVGRNAFLDVSQ